MLKRFKNTLKSKRGQIGEILVVVVLIILAVLGIVKYVMPMFDKNKALSSTAGDQMDAMSSQAKTAQWGNVGDEVPAQTVINTWNAVMAAKATGADTRTIASTATCSYKNTGETDNRTLVAAGTQGTFAAYEAGTAKINRTGIYYVTAITFDKTTGQLTSITYDQR